MTKPAPVSRRAPKVDHATAHPAIAAPIAATPTPVSPAEAAELVEEELKKPGMVTLDEPLVRGTQTIVAVHVRKPKSGELRGLSLTAILNLDYAALEALLPRITMPMLTKQDVARLDLADIMQLGGEVISFLLPKASKDSVTA